MDIRQIALYLAGKLPPHYKKHSTTHLIRLLQETDGAYFNDDKIKLIRSENSLDEDFFYGILDSISRIANSQREQSAQYQTLLNEILKEYEVGNELTGAEIGATQETIITDIKPENDEQRIQISDNFKIKLVEIEEGRGGSQEYEKIIGEIIRYLFSDSMKSFYLKEQVRNTPSLNIRDRIMLNNPSSNHNLAIGFREDAIRKDYQSSFITIECKNYTDPADQTPVITTLKYLEKPGIGRFGMMFTRNGLSQSGQNAVVDLLRGNSEKKPICMMVFNDGDINNMLDLKAQNKPIEQYLLDKYFDLQTSI